MQYFALRDGHVGKAVKVIRGGKELHQAHILLGDVFEYDGPKGSWMEPYTGQDKPKLIGKSAPETATESLESSVPELPEELTGEKTKNQIVEELKVRGIPFNIREKKEDLFKLLEG